MITRSEILGRAVDDCIKELYTLVQPAVEWDDFVEQCKVYSEKHREWEDYIRAKHRERENPDNWIKQQELHPDWNDKKIQDCIGPAPYDFYYLPKEVMNDVCDSYVYAYKMNSQQELLDTIEILKNYCKKPIVDKYIEEHTDEYGNYHPGYRGYAHPDNLEKEIYYIINNYNHGDTDIDLEGLSNELCQKFFSFLDMAGNFYNWTRDLSTFNQSIYGGISPTSNKENVINNWKKYRNIDIEIDESKYKEDDEDYE